MPAQRYMLLFVLGITCAANTYAGTQSDRKYFLKAETALNKGDIKAWEKLKPRLKDYPLYADLVFKRAIQKIGNTKVDQATKTLDELKQTPLRKTYLKSWLKRLAARKHWNSYIKFYEENLGTKAKCQYAHALYQTGQANTALPVARQLWLEGKSQPKACDSAFKFFKQSKQLDNELVWQRIELAINKGKVSLVKYLRKMLPKNDQGLVTEWLRVRSKPERVLTKKYLASDHPMRKKMLFYGIRRMALFEADKALIQWNKIKHNSKLDHNDIQSLERWIALRLTTQKLSDAVTQHQQVSGPLREDLEWASRAALQTNDWAALKDFIGNMGDISQLSDRWKYWKARAAEQLGDKTTATTIYHLLASDRGYHNFLAADRLSLPYQLKHQPLKYTQEDLQHLLDDYNVQRMHELYQLDRLPEARREWYYLVRRYGDADRQKLAYILKQWGWHSLAILAIARADYNDDLSIRFPVMYENQITRAAKSSRLDISWVMALVRQESAFQPDARSSAGARGLMQLMPATSRHVARLLKRRRPKIHELYQPDVNIKLGTHYLKSNLQKYNDHKVLTTAAYNAGPHRVTKWLPDNVTLDADAWTEAVPFKETRGYIQRIMSYAAIYDHHLGKNITPLSQRMPQVSPGAAP